MEIHGLTAFDVTFLRTPDAAERTRWVRFYSAESVARADAPPVVLDVYPDAVEIRIERTAD